jgi:transposase
MLNAVLLNESENVAVDTYTCPCCGSEMVRYAMDNPNTIYGRTYVCHNCGHDEIVSPELEEEY